MILKILKYLIPIFILLLLSCDDNENAEIIEPVACFEFSPIEKLDIDTEITFINCSENATKYIWDFGDGDTIWTKNPTHKYESYGNYEVTLIAVNNDGRDTISFDLEITKTKNYFEFRDTVYDLGNAYYENKILCPPETMVCIMLSSPTLEVYNYGNESYGNLLFLDFTPHKDDSIVPTGNISLLPYSICRFDINVPGRDVRDVQLKSGSLTIEKIDSIYIIDFECKTDEEEILTGNYTGIIQMPGEFKSWTLSNNTSPCK